jgi:hypothetical protein
MMQMTQGWTRLRIVAIALGLFASASSIAKADAILTTKADGILTYSTSGFVGGSTGVSTTLNGSTVAPTTNAITYGSVNNASVDAVSNLPLGEFQVAPLAANMTTTYNNTPFSFTLIPSAYNGAALSNFTPLTITGMLNGTLTGGSQSSVIATISSISNNTFQLGGATSTLAGLPNQVLLVPNSAGGVTTLEAAINTVGTVGPSQAPVPEPSTIALFLTTVGGLALRRYVLARRPRAVA